MAADSSSGNENLPNVGHAGSRPVAFENSSRGVEVRFDGCQRPGSIDEGWQYMLTEWTTQEQALLTDVELAGLYHQQHWPAWTRWGNWCETYSIIRTLTQPKWLVT